MKKIFIFIMMFLFFVVCQTTTIKASNTLCDGAKSAILMESQTGEILFEKNKDVKRAPASMTKIMTLLLVYEALESNKITKDDMVRTSLNASQMGGSQVYLKENELISVDDILKCICIASANDCAVAIAEHLCGSEDAFVNKMNKKAEEIGCINTNFENVTGLSSQNHYSCSYDMAIMSRELILKYNDVLNYSKIKEDYIRKDTENPFWLVNTNKLLGHLDGLLGLKTGFTSDAMYCISLVMNKNNMTLISVVMGYDTALSRNSESAQLLNYGFANYKMTKIIDKQTVYAKVSDINYTPQINYVVCKDDVYVLTKIDEEINYMIDFKYEINPDCLNSKIGEVYVLSLDNNIISKGDLILKETAIKNSFLDKIIIVLLKLFC